MGSPSTSERAISVTAGIDDTEKNWKFPASKFSSPSEPSLLVKAISGEVSLPISEAEGIEGPLVFVGEAKETDVGEELRGRLSGRVALIDRGAITFQEKLTRVKEAGSIGAVVVNNVPGDPIYMGGEQVHIPAIMISQEVGQKVKALMEEEEVRIFFKTSELIEQPELIGTLGPFSSKGPRALDGLLKPEITAPGVGVVSVLAGSGNQGVASGGTSMASPHVAGVAALLKQLYPDMGVQEVKALIMNTARRMVDKKGEEYPVSMQGAGMVQVVDATTSLVHVQTQKTPTVLGGRADLSLGLFSLEAPQLVSGVLELKNRSDEEQAYSVSYEGAPALSIEMPSYVTVPSEGSSSLSLQITIDPSVGEEGELDGFIVFKQGEEVKIQVPILTVVSRASRVVGEGFEIFSSSLRESVGVEVEVTLKNEGVFPGSAYLFNILGLDFRKPPSESPFLNRDCDLESVGYRVVDKSREGDSALFLQVALKMFNPITDWQRCYVWVGIDEDGDWEADQVIRGMLGDHFSGLMETFPHLSRTYASFHMDSKKMKEQQKIREEEKEPLNYIPALIRDEKGNPAIYDFKVYPQSTLAIVETRVDLLPQPSDGQIALDVSVYHGDEDVEPNDNLGKGYGAWLTISVGGEAYTGMPEVVALDPGESQTVRFTKGAKRRGELMLFAPHNVFNLDREQGEDFQSALMSPIFEGPRTHNPHF